MSSVTALVIEDEADIRKLLSMAINRMGIDCHVAANLEEARHLLADARYQVCLTDMKLPDGNGVDFVRYIQSVQPDLPVAVVSAHGNMEAAVEAMKNGAFDFVSKPVDIHLLRKLITTAIATHATAANDARTQPHSSVPATHGGTPITHGRAGTHALVGDSPPIQNLRKMILKLARSNAPVWITGESGTGKELIARLIHTNSARAAAPFVPINCGAIPSELMESELFGHKKGSFTGAMQDHDGLFLQAEGGTLFLDEVAELPLHMQVKLLRVIQEKSLRRVGDTQEQITDVRILSASHKDLSAEVEAGRFRHDLYYRLNVITLTAPSLASRASDLPQLIRHFLNNMTNGTHQASITLDDAAQTALNQHSFPGNVRELENILERALAMTEGNTIRVEDLGPLNITSTNHLSPDDLQKTHRHDSPSNGAVHTQSPNRDINKETIVATLEHTRWNRKQAAEQLGMTYRQLRYRIQQLGIISSDKSD